MSKIIIVKLTKLGSRLSKFSIYDNLENLLLSDITKDKLSEGITLTVNDSVLFLSILALGKNCAGKSIKVPITEITNIDIASLDTEIVNTSSLWKHLTDISNFNTYYGNIDPYIIEYPFQYQYQDEILQSIKDYTKVYKYANSSNINRKIQPDDAYFNKAILYNDQQSSGLLLLNSKPQNNMKEYMSYPKYNSDSKSILYTKSDNFYQYNTFWDVVTDKNEPLFIDSCESMSIDKIINDENMNYSTKSFKKSTIRAKDLKIRTTLDNRNDINLVSQFITQESQLSYK